MTQSRMPRNVTQAVTLSGRGRLESQPLHRLSWTQVLRAFPQSVWENPGIEP
jgi:hypothetical protein